MPKHVVVIGAGQAGASLVAKLRSEGFWGDVTLIGAERDLPYMRPPLSKAYLLGDIPRERLYLRPQSYFAEQNIKLMLGRKVDSVDTSTRQICVGSETIQYDDLVFTTGAHARTLPAAVGGDLAGVYVVRTLDDVDAFSSEFVAGRRALIVGGGYIGLEAAAVAAKKGLSVTLIEAADRILQRVACSETSDFFRELHRENGVEICEGVGLKSLTGQANRVKKAMLDDGRELEIDFVIAGIGVLPTTALAEKAGVALENGIRVDEYGRTGTPHIWAAGDCASFPYQDRRIRLESVPNAIDQAEAVAQNLLGAEKPYEAKPWFWSDQYNVKLQIAGLNSGYDKVVLRNQGKGTSIWYYASGSLIAVDAANDPRAYMIGKRMIESAKTPSPELVADPEVNLKSLL